jgi:large conductance mechanosensitive channel
MLKGFRDFLFRGNIIDLAVAVVIGTAFVALVATFTAAVITPILAVFGGGNELGWGFQLTDNPATFINIGALVTALITFVITAAVVYFLVVVPAKKAQGVLAREQEAEPEPEEQVVLLREIRDSLRAQGSDRSV